METLQIESPDRGVGIITVRFNVFTVGAVFKDVCLVKPLRTECRSRRVPTRLSGNISTAYVCRRLQNTRHEKKNKKQNKRTENIIIARNVGRAQHWGTRPVRPRKRPRAHKRAI